MSRRYMPPIDARTGALWMQPRLQEMVKCDARVTFACVGALWMQPRLQEMVPGWALDAGLEWNPPQFIDAPDLLPAGAVRALDCVMELTLGVQEVGREL